MLSLGFVFSLVWLAGIGSFIALILGLRARNLINQSTVPISGSGIAWWCIVVGAIGTVVMPTILLRDFLK